MSETEHPETRAEEHTGTPGPERSAADTGPASDVSLDDELRQLRREVEDLQQRNLRLLAEVQNLQKRTQRERQEALRYAEADFARDLLVILDDLERTQTSAQTAQDVQAVADGVRIVYEHFLKLLREHGVRPIEALGRPFDPTYHEAMMQQPSDEFPSGTVMQELARGYTMHDRVLRSSRVVVSSGPANAAPAKT